MQVLNDINVSLSSLKSEFSQMKQKLNDIESSLLRSTENKQNLGNVMKALENINGKIDASRLASTDEVLRPENFIEKLCCETIEDFEALNLLLGTENDLCATYLVFKNV